MAVERTTPCEAAMPCTVDEPDLGLHTYESDYPANSHVSDDTEGSVIGLVAETTRTGGEITLYSTLSEPVYFDIPGGVVEVPRVSPVILLDSDEHRRVVELNVADNIVAVPVDRGPVVAALGMPPEIAGVWYLVDQELAARCPHRGDFVVVGMFRLDMAALERLSTGTTGTLGGSVASLRQGIQPVPPDTDCENQGIWP